MSKTPRWRSFEEAVAQIYGLFTPSARITRNARVKDRLGHIREFDVLIEDFWGGHNLLAVIECKDLKRKVNNPDVEAFIQKSEKIRANFRAIVSARGFTKPALQTAAHEGVGAMSLLPKEGNISGFALYAPVCVDWWAWGRAKMHLKFLSPAEASPIDNIFSVTYQGKSVFAWFVKLLKQDFERTQKKGVLPFGVRFPSGIGFVVEGSTVSVSEAWLLVERKHLRKFRRLKISGDAFYDWHKKCLRWPDQGALVTEAIDTHDLQNWDDYEGEFPVLITKADTQQGVALFQVQMEAHDSLPDFGADAARIDRTLWEPID